jgi:hypothetical protein
MNKIRHEARGMRDPGKIAIKVSDFALQFLLVDKKWNSI